MPDAARTTIRRLKLVATQGDPLLLRLRAENQLNAASLTVPGLPPSAILLVRTLKTPPLALQSSPGLPLAWEQSARASLTDLARRAARPINAPAAPDAPAVLFADYVELLACLVIDLIASAADQRWWWRTFFGKYSPSAAFDAWLTHPQDAPAALRLLEQRASAIPFLRIVPPTFVETLTSRVLSAFGLAHLSLFLGNAPEDEPRPVFPPAPGRLPTPRPAPADFSALPPGLAEKTFFSPERLPNGITCAAWVLLNLGLAIQRAPGSLFSVNSAERLYETLLQIPGQVDISAWKTLIDQDKESSLEKVDPKEQTGSLVLPMKAENTVRTDQRPQPDSLQPDLLLAKTVETQFGGIFYLLNVAIALDLYGDFSMPAYRGIHLSPWNYLALLGREFLGKDFVEDPLLALLAELAGQENADKQDEMVTDAINNELVETIRARLLAAFGEMDFEHLVALLFYEPARIFVSAARLDVNFSLERHPIEIRIAGLDRDIGWLPAGGMAVYYHYD